MSDNDLGRFVSAQDRHGIYARALEELKAGRKQSHWMWFVFPQIAGLGQSETARFYAIENLAEARAFLAHPTLGGRLQECTGVVSAWAGQRSATDIFGPLDAQKFHSCMTLFDVAGSLPCFAEAMELFYCGKRDERTLALLAG